MKKISALALAAALVLSLVGCRGGGEDDLAFLRRPARITFRPDGTELSLVLETVLTDGRIAPASLAVTLPETLFGITFRFSGDPVTVTATTEHLSIPLSDGAGAWLLRWGEMFLFSKADVLTDTPGEGGREITASAAGGTVTVLLSAETGLPVHVTLDAGGVTLGAAVEWEAAG